MSLSKGALAFCESRIRNDIDRAVRAAVRAKHAGDYGAARDLYRHAGDLHAAAGSTGRAAWCNRRADKLVADADASDSVAKLNLSIHIKDICSADYLQDLHDRDGELLVGVPFTAESTYGELLDDALAQFAWEIEPGSAPAWDEAIKRERARWQANVALDCQPDSIDVAAENPDALVWFVAEWVEDGDDDGDYNDRMMARYREQFDAGSRVLEDVRKNVGFFERWEAAASYDAAFKCFRAAKYAAEAIDDVGLVDAADMMLRAAAAKRDEYLKVLA